MRTVKRVAAAAIFCFAPAHAQGDEARAELSLYGVVHVSLDQASEVADEDWRVASNSSRLGIRGRYSVSDQISMILQVEPGVDVTNVGRNDGNGPGDTSGVFTRARDSFVGVQTPFGTIRYGRQGLLNLWVYDVNLFADQVGDLGNLWGAGGFAGRGDNTISYQTPEIGGLTGTVLYTPSPSDTPDDDVFAIKLGYRYGGWSLGAAIAEAQPENPLSEDYTIGAVTTSYTLDETEVGGVDISGSMVGVGWQHESNVRDSLGRDRHSATAAGLLRLNRRHGLKVQYTKLRAEQNASDARQIAVGYDFEAREDLTLYVAYARTQNDTLAAFTANNYGHGKAQTPQNSGADPSLISFGAIYRFECGC